MRLVVAVIALFLLTGANSADIGELPKDGQYQWEVEQVPSNVTVYWDYDFDGHADTVFACPVTGSGRLSTCNIKMETSERDYLFTNCPWYNLPKVHAMLKDQPYSDKMCIENSYFSVLKKATSG